MKKIIFLLVGLIILCSFYQANAQTTATSIYSKNHIVNEKPIPYAHIREADVMFSKLIWRVINLREKMNQPMYYPTRPMDDRYSLIDLLMFGIENEGLTAYDTEDDEFTQPLTLEDIRSKFGAGVDTIRQPNRETGLMETKIVPRSMTTSEVTKYWVKEQWIFDKQSSTLQVRIIGLCPIREYVKDGDSELDGLRKKKMFWIFFPEARQLLATHEVFNQFNDARRFSYDDLFMKRRFSSYITQVSNVHDNRSIESYTVGLQTMLESERIKNDIMNMESDFWEY
ncbi:gliding motility protein GldN [Ancylomarina sp. 16SWW S1-10-2]|uniref:type IX secretion system ring protein PorN/GldN n=1 Tax=Ancylomarina sp. 16SWW S1-10-2 TaxID=2499681 RepID=UPI0012ADEBE3|nr:gliding motility protein GldN [Ancylomarina sp. 16SWW S1-10-2]MRT92442.1 gliding motility protein GldN [Ancylomarina sp. 16SWW S1-10-2]